MKLLTAVCSSLLAASAVEAHYYFPWFIANGTQFSQWKYVRKIDGVPLDEYYPTPALARAWPVMDVYSTNHTCGRNAFDYASQTGVADVLAGSEVGFRLNSGTDDDAATWGGLNHPGPALVYLARVPGGDFNAFSGVEGEWVKIVEIGARNDDEWILQDYQRDNVMNFTIPLQTPPGKYLLRFEHLSLRELFMGTQAFINCAQINVIGEGGGSFEGYPFAKFPGTYDPMDPSLYVSFEQERGHGIAGYVGPGPPVWKP